MKVKYSAALCRTFTEKVAAAKLHISRRPLRYEVGHTLKIDIKGLLPAVEGKAELLIERFLGGGFAGQVYCCRLNSLELPDNTEIPGLTVGELYAIKIIVPPSSSARAFRNAVYWLAYQGPFSAQVNYAACRSGLLWQKLMRCAGLVKFGRESALKDAYASFWDNELGAYGELVEWVEGRMWLLEADTHLKERKNWREINYEESDSKEFIAKRRFMAAMVELMHEMGAPELARQYEWWTMKSQPNSIKRTDIPEGASYDGLCAIDFRPGLALLPYLPMSPGDFKLILSGLFKRRALVQFDRCDLEKLDEYISAHPEAFAGKESLIEELKIQEHAYRRSQPDITKQGLRLLYDSKLRSDVRAGLVDGYQVNELVDSDFAGKLKSNGFRFSLYYLLGAIPFIGKFIRRLWGNGNYRKHFKSELTSWSYLIKAVTFKAQHRLIDWHRCGRVGEKQTHFLVRHPFLFFVLQGTIGLLPPWLYRTITEPKYAVKSIGRVFGFIYMFCKKAEFREKWFLDIIEEGEKQGMLTPSERETITAHVHDPYVIKYLKCLAAHFATLPLTQIVAVIVGGCAVAWMLAQGHSFAKASVVFGGVLVFFQVFPISPGSIGRGLFVVYLMIRERNISDYLIAAPLSFVKYIGYLAFPLQMAAAYPQLARFMAGRWATSAVHWIPVFGEKGALLEHWVYDLFFNRMQMLTRWCKPRIKGLLTTWLLIGLTGIGLLFWKYSFPISSRASIQLIILGIAVFIFPRMIFFPLMTRSSKNVEKNKD